MLTNTLRIPLLCILYFGLFSTAYSQSSPNLELYVLMEAPYDPSLGEMTTTLETLNLIPNNQPFNQAPWDYDGTETKSISPISDWVLVSFRTDVDANTEIARAAGLLQIDGRIHFPNPDVLPNDFNTPVYVVIETRNHLIVMSPQPITITNGVLAYDFSATDSYSNNGGIGQKQLSNGQWVMYAGDINNDLDINGADKALWNDANGFFDTYLNTDIDLNGDINGGDKALWNGNNGVFSSVPNSRSLAYALLASVADTITLNGTYTSKYYPSEAQARGFDARDATFVTGDIQWGTVDINSGSSITDMVWAGGYFHSGKPWDASWDDHKATYLPDLPGRNSAAIENRSTGTTLTGVYTHNVHDAYRSTSAVDWVVQHSWSTYTRDDAIENDKFVPGRVYDCLFDGTYAGISARPSSGSTLDANGNVLTLRKVTVRMQAMPYPYKWDTKPETVVDANNDPWIPGVSQGIPYGHGSMFKIINNADPKNMHWDIKHCTFVAMANMEDTSLLDFPDASLIDELENVTVVWLGDGPFPGYLPTSEFPGQITVLTGTAGLNHYWTRVRNWHNRHPDVEPSRKPDPNTYYTPIVFPENF